MPQRALIEKRPWLLASSIAGISYFFVKDSQLPGLYLMAWKGRGGPARRLCPGLPQGRICGRSRR